MGTMKKKEDTAELKSTTALAALDSAGWQETVWLSLQQVKNCIKSRMNSCVARIEE